MQVTIELSYTISCSPVVAQLLQGTPVTPESFENVTIGFADIVGFQNIILHLMPVQVGKILLNSHIKIKHD